MYLRALGPLALLVDGAVVDVRPGRQPLLLACLLARANRVVPYDTLTAALWPGSVGDLRDALRPVVSRVRHCLDAEAGGRARLITRTTGYELVVGPEEFDVFTFEAELRRGRAAAEHGHYADAEQALGAALSVWRGPAYAEFRDLALLRPESARLDELRKAAVEDQIEVELALGHALDVVARLGSLVEDEPFRERRWGQLMLALYRCGRQAEALQAYRRVHDLLLEELGVVPTPQLVVLEQRILRHDPALDGPTAALEAAGPARVRR